MSGETKPSDLCSKMHENVAQGLNSNFWRKGHKSYLMPEFPSVLECVVYARLSGEKFTYYRLPSSSFVACFELGRDAGGFYGLQTASVSGQIASRKEVH